MARQRASAFNQPLSLVDTSKVTNMHYMFCVASAFNQPLNLETTSVTNMRGMFRGASAFNQPLSFITSGVTDMSQMFYSASALSDANKVLISCAWAGNAEFVGHHDWSGLGACPSPPSPPPLSPSPTSPPSPQPLPPPPLPTPFANKADLVAAVLLWVNDRATALSTYGHISGWDVSLITDMSGLFRDLATFNDDISSWDTSGVTNMDSMFRVRSLACLCLPMSGRALRARRCAHRRCPHALSPLASRPASSRP